MAKGAGQTSMRASRLFKPAIKGSAYKKFFPQDANLIVSVPCGKRLLILCCSLSVTADVYGRFIPCYCPELPACSKSLFRQNRCFCSLLLVSAIVRSAFCKR